MSITVEIDESIARDEGNAVLIDWANAADLFGTPEHDPEATILYARYCLQANRWVWNAVAKQLEREGWKVWFRSQGQLSRPIAQWSKIV